MKKSCEFLWYYLLVYQSICYKNTLLFLPFTTSFCCASHVVTGW